MAGSPTSGWTARPASFFLLLLALLRPTATAAGPQLRFRGDGTFVIAQFADLHYSNDPGRDRLSDEVQSTVLQAEKPDFVAFSGDQVSGFAWDGQPGWFEAAWRQLIAPVHAAGPPYASVLGNHDGEADLRRSQATALDVSTGGNLSLTQAGPRYLTGAGNYWLDVYDAAGSRVAARIWMLDSGNRGCDELPDGWGCVPRNTVAWVEERAAELPRVPSLAFIHIPLPQFLEMWNAEPTRGSKNSSVACPLADSGMFAALKRAGIGAVYSGHDHGCDYVGTWQGVRLAYGRKTGHGSSGPRGPKGARIISLRLGQSTAASATWIRTEAGLRDSQERVTPPAHKRKQQRCTSDYWLLQRLRDRSFVLFLVTSVAAAIALIAATATITVLAMRWQQRRARRLLAGDKRATEERQWLRAV